MSEQQTEPDLDRADDLRRALATVRAAMGEETWAAVEARFGLGGRLELGDFVIRATEALLEVDRLLDQFEEADDDDTTLTGWGEHGDS